MDLPKKSAMAGLPDDPVVEILSRLPVKELHRSKCVCKGWRDLIADPIHRKKLPQTLHGFFPSYAGKLGSFINQFGGSPSPVDPASPFLKKLPDIHNILFSGSCNGLLLFNHSTSLSELSYIVFNPATEQWSAVPSERTPADRRIQLDHICLVFDPAVSPYFRLVIIYREEGSLATVHSYYSETGLWRHTQIDWADKVKQLGHWNVGHPQIRGTQIRGTPAYAALLNSMLYLLLTDNQIAEVDLEGKMKRVIPVPSSVDKWVHGCSPVFIGQSQGRLYCINEEQWPHHIPSELSNRVYKTHSTDHTHLLSIWVLEDHDTQKWVLKHSVSYLRLFGCFYCSVRGLGYNVVAIHPDNNDLVFILLSWEHRLISYGLNSKEVRTVSTLQESLQFPPYVPCFLDFLSVAHHEEKLGVDQQDKREGRRQDR